MTTWTTADLASIDPDALLIATYQGKDMYCVLAVEANIGMMCPVAQARYRAIYGREWVPVPPIGGEIEELELLEISEAEIVIELDLSDYDYDRLVRAALPTV